MLEVEGRSVEELEVEGRSLEARLAISGTWIRGGMVTFELHLFRPINYAHVHSNAKRSGLLSRVLRLEAGRSTPQSRSRESTVSVLS